MYPNHIMRIVNRQNHLANPPSFEASSPFIFLGILSKNLNEKSSHHRLLNGFLPWKKRQSFRHMDVKGLGFFQAFQGTSYLECSKDPNDPHRWDPIWGEQRFVGFFAAKADCKRAVGWCPSPFGAGNVWISCLVSWRANDHGYVASVH